jgi:hypothetical protein
VPVPHVPFIVSGVAVAQVLPCAEILFENKPERHIIINKS